MSKPYFSPDFFRFLKELKANNNREWFQANKERYEKTVRDPFLDFITDLAAPLKKIAPHVVVDPRPVGGSMFRIYRDVRFSKDKSPYKTAIAAHFRHGKGGDISAPGYYLHLEPGDCMIGGGIWHPEPPTLKRIRDAIVANPRKWQKITGGKALGSAGFMGESLKRAPPGYPADHPLIEDLKRKDFAVSVSMTEKQVTSSDVLTTAVGALKMTGPFISFLAEATGLEI
jgi:uncharacterized protein (TIGR02453 family)